MSSPALGSLRHLECSDRAFLLTGATGLVGRTWLPILKSRRPEMQIIAIVRRPEDVVRLSRPGVIALLGDLTKPDLGLQKPDYQILLKTVEEMIHCAADIRFSSSLEEARSINVNGTQNLLNLARHSQRCEKFAHLSTVYVVGDRTGDFQEKPVQPGRFLSPYQQSKYEAEEIVLRAANEVPAAIYRLSTVIGDSKSGHVQQFNYFHQLLKLALSNPLPVIPSEPDAPIDLITSDWAVAALDHLFTECFTPGEIFHICAGPERSLTANSLIDFTFNFFEGHPRRAATWHLRRPQLMSLPEFEQYAQQSLANGLRHRFWQSLSRFLPHLGLSQSFRHSKTSAALTPTKLAHPPIRESLTKVLGYCCETNWGQQ